MNNLYELRMKEINEHLVAESTQDMKALIDGMTEDCFNDVANIPEPFIGPERVALRYSLLWQGFPDFTVRVKRVLGVGEDTITTENEWTGTHLGTFLDQPATGRSVKMRALVVWHFTGPRLKGETIFFDTGSILKQMGAIVTVPDAG